MRCQTKQQSTANRRCQKWLRLLWYSLPAREQRRWRRAVILIMGRRSAAAWFLTLSRQNGRQRARRSRQFFQKQLKTLWRSETRGWLHALRADRWMAAKLVYGLVAVMFSVSVTFPAMTEASFTDQENADVGVVAALYGPEITHIELPDKTIKYGKSVSYGGLNLIFANTHKTYEWRLIGVSGQTDFCRMLDLKLSVKNGGTYYDGDLLGLNTGDINYYNKWTIKYGLPNDSCGVYDGDVCAVTLSARTLGAGQNYEEVFTMKLTADVPHNQERPCQDDCGGRGWYDPNDGDQGDDNNQSVAVVNDSGVGTDGQSAAVDNAAAGDNAAVNVDDSNQEQSASGDSNAANLTPGSSEAFVPATVSVDNDADNAAAVSVVNDNGSPAADTAVEAAPASGAEGSAIFGDAPATDNAPGV